MNKLIAALLVTAVVSGTAAASEGPSEAQFHAYKAYHHGQYLVVTAESAGGTNKLVHTTSLPTEGTDPVVSPALDHLYSKAVVDLTKGPVVLTLPKVEDRYFSLHITDQEHYTIYDEIRPRGTYVFVRYDYKGEVPAGTVIKSRGDYPHVFVRTQAFNSSELENVKKIQDKITLKGVVGSISVKNDDYLQFTINSHDVYDENSGLLESLSQTYTQADHAKIREYLYAWYAKSGLFSNEGAFGPIDSKENHSDNTTLRAAGIIGHLGLPVHHAYYAPMFINCDKKRLNGSKDYSITVPYKNPGVGEFWSVTRYSQLTGNTIPGKNDLFNAYNTKPDANGNVTITFSATEPNDGTYWMPVNKDEPYYYVERYYAPDADTLVTSADACPQG
ncbi:DUF1254 domain-containing protein [Thalassotalea psychrophila]|uniref:DUF1254 domain-containing protein n=1 Tax=Thalassotalea psychrophila TaxID=3065647 RepID=A0ABY9TS13_9GAMM|nr:DUF1254 domain-containing protein [Colwelliaceae bacterium SQ149]